ncbi:RNA-directed DNA polymerase, eukaryota, reverse transcriptase zinc-binding domain protein [Tanacetum coccineum]
MENYNDPPVALTLRSKLSLIKSLKDDTEAVPFTYTINGHEIQFGREEFCLITGLRFGVEFSDDYLHGPLDLRRRVWESHVDGNNIIGQMLIDKILSEEFYSLRDEDAVAVCLLAVLHMVLLGQEPKNNVPKWWLSLVDDINMWEKYPWGSYIWPKLYRQLKDANPKRWDRFYASLRGPIRRPAKYTLSGFTWAFKTWILEAYKERALNYYTHVDRHPRAVAWVNAETFYRSYLEAFFEGAKPIRILRADAFEAKAEWWVSSRAFFDGRICEPPQIPPAAPNDIYQCVAEQDRLIKELQQHNVDQYKILNSMNKNFKGLNASCMPEPMKAPFEVREYFGLSDLSGFQNTEVPKSVLQTMESIRRNFFNGVQCDERKIVWIKWAKVLASKKYGGLGVSSFYALNRALLFKWVWRFISRDNSLWCRLIMSMHGSSLYKLSPFRYSTWKSIIREVHMLKDRGVDLISHCHIRVGNGLRTQFWNEVWIGDTQLRVMFPRIYALEINKDCTVADKLQFSVTSSLRRSVRGGVESSQLALLQTYIEGTLLSNMEDRWVWDLNGEGVFRVKDVRILLDECFLPKAPTATRWVKYVPIKINVFAWKVFLDRKIPRTCSSVADWLRISSGSYAAGGIYHGRPLVHMLIGLIGSIPSD